MNRVLEELLNEEQKQNLSIDKNILVTGLSDDSRKVKRGDLFFAVPGTNDDGLRYAEEALEKGAVAVVVEEEHANQSFIKVNSVRKAMADIGDRFYNKPFEKLRIHGITGTNGKSTIAILLRNVLERAGIKTALSGTLYRVAGAGVEKSNLTTPGILELLNFADQALSNGCTDLVMEVSSHALEQNRTGSMKFASAIFTNLTQDHLDYHKNMESYFSAKKKLFFELAKKDAVLTINLDDSRGEKLYEELKAQNKILVGTSRKKNTDCSVKSIQNFEDHMELLVQYFDKNLQIKTSLLGEFNQENILAVVATACALHIDKEAIEAGLKGVQVPGRMELVANVENKKVIVDYAHTPDALKRILEATKPLCQNELLVVFGCGGDRDKEKRPLMAEAACKYADRIVITSDNPRTEDPEQIIQDILKGISKDSKYEVVSDRHDAIFKACASMQSGDVLVLAGKGHEDYQIIGTKRIPFDDRVLAREAMGE